MLSQFFILTPRGDTIVAKDYRGDVARGTSEIFFRKLKSFSSDPPPIFNMEGVHFAHIKRSNLYFVTTTKFNVAPAMTLELLQRVANLIKDYCGTLSEESIRVNFVLVYELLDEVIDFGYGQTTATESLKAHVYKEPIAVALPDRPPSHVMPSAGRPGARRSLPPSAANKPVSMRVSGDRGKNEVFLDLIERLTVLFNASGSVLRAEVSGAIQMKSFLQGAPEISLGLNEDLIIGKERGLYGLMLDDCNFHEAVNLDQFDSSRALTLRPPDGEFTLMNYRISGEAGGFAHPLPFRVAVAVEDTSSASMTYVLLKLDADMPSKHFGSNVVVRLPLPKSTSACGHELGTVGHTFQYKKDDNVAVWTVPRIVGGTSCYVRLRLSVPEEDKHKVRQEVGPISLDFEVPMYVCSGMNIRFLRVSERGKRYTPFRWVRYITQADSYVFRC